jgi:hypothetical protein
VNIHFNRYDWRLTFTNLKKNLKINKVAPRDRELIWIPNLVFENNAKGEYVKNDALSSINVKMEGEPEVKQTQDLMDMEEFTGMYNPLIFTRIYEMKLGCDFELYYFPFDTQKCYITVSASFRVLFCLF